MKLISARLVRRVFLPCALLALLLLLGTQPLPASAESLSFVRLVDASPAVGTMDVFVDGAKFLGNTLFASVTDYLQLPAGYHRVEVVLGGLYLLSWANASKYSDCYSHHTALARSLSCWDV